MPFADYKDFADCVSKNSNKEDPEAYCATIMRKTEMRHPDFEKIYNQFLATVPDGETRYSEWITSLNLDESKPYGRCFKEAWYHRHIDFRKWKEDAQATFWKVEVGFPVESMNRNVYTQEELQLASRTLKDGYVNINHKFPLPTVKIPAAEAVKQTITLPDGKTVETIITEAVVRVPNNLMCPICHTDKTINQLITEGGIVNVSLESSCSYLSDGNRCEGMTFDGFAFLTSRVLPGIPLTRIQPLESIMIEALEQAEIPYIARVKPMKSKQILKMEAVDDCPEGQQFNPDTGQCEPTSQEQVDTKGMDAKAILPDEAGQCPPGYILSTAMGQCIPDQNCPEGQHFDQQTSKCVPDTTALPAASVTAVGSSPTPQESTPQDVKDPSEKPSDPIRSAQPLAGPTKDTTVPQIPTDEPAVPMELPTGTPPLSDSQGPDATSPDPTAHDCPDGYQFDLDAGMCVPSSPLTERIARMKAEDKAKFWEKSCLQWQKRTQILDKALNEVRGIVTEQKATIQRLEKRADGYNLSKVEDEVKLREMKRRVEDLTIDLDDKRRAHEKLQQEHQQLTEKYDNVMTLNLELSKRNTKSNEDYLTVARKNELLEASLGKARNQAKKIVRIKAP